MEKRFADKVDRELLELHSARARLSHAECEALDEELARRGLLPPGKEPVTYARELGPGAWKLLLFLALCVAALPFAWNHLAPQPGELPDGTSAETVDSAPAPVQATVSTHPGLGLGDPASIPPLVLRQLEKWMTDMVVENARARRADLGHDDNYAPQVEARTHTLPFRGRTVAVYDAVLDRRIRIVMVLGSHADNLIRVTCMRPSPHEIALDQGECGEKLAVAFDLPPSP